MTFDRPGLGKHPIPDTEIRVGLTPFYITVEPCISEHVGTHPLFNQIFGYAKCTNHGVTCSIQQVFVASLSYESAIAPVVSSKHSVSILGFKIDDPYPIPCVIFLHPLSVKFVVLIIQAF